MKLEVGMYVRYKRGSMGYNIEPVDKIGKVINQVNNSDLYELDNNNNIFENDVVKASHNIIDLIKAGDYVNGLRVTSVYKSFEGEVLISLGANFGFSKFDNDYTITSIVTKEQFESMEYRIGEKNENKNNRFISKNSK